MQSAVCYGCICAGVQGGAVCVVGTNSQVIAVVADVAAVYHDAVVAVSVGGVYAATIVISTIIDSGVIPYDAIAEGEPPAQVGSVTVCRVACAGQVSVLELWSMMELKKLHSAEDQTPAP